MAHSARCSLDRGKALRSPGGDAEDAEATAAVADVGREPVAVRGAAVLSVVEPGPAAQDAKGAGLRTLRVLPWGFFVVVLAVPVSAPLPDVAVQVEEPKRVGR